MKHNFLSAFFIFLIVFAVSLKETRAGADEQHVEKFVSSLSDKVLKVLNASEVLKEEKEKELERIFEDSVDIDWMGRFVTGPYWRRSDKSQQSEYLKYYRSFLKQSYIPQFRSYTNQSVEITKVSVLDRKNEYLVETTIVSPKQQQPIKVDYKIRKNNGDYKIFDILAEGISLITTQRSDFRQILSREGIEYLTEKLKARTTS